MLRRNQRIFVRSLLGRCFSNTTKDVIVDFPLPGVAHVQLNRLQGRNSLSKSFMEEFNSAIAEHGKKSLVLVISSNVPKVFCAGADLKERATMTQDDVGVFVNFLRSSFAKVAEVESATIAAIEGAAMGGGAELAMACDLRIGGKDVMIGFPEVCLGIIPGAGGTVRLPRIIGESKAKELILTGRRLNATDALAYGLFNEIVDSGKAVTRALEVAAEIAKNSPLGVKNAKASIDEGMSVGIKEAYKVEGKCYHNVLVSEDRLEGLKAFAEKRSPVFKGK